MMLYISHNAIIEWKFVLTQSSVYTVLYTSMYCDSRKAADPDL